MTAARADSARPVSARDFAGLMAGLGPFERPPTLAVAVSGGADSMALTLLAADWVRKRGGSVVGLTVDHRLRPESGREARQVAAWLSARGIAHRNLVWTGEKPSHGLQVAAREARYGLLEDWCRRHGILHLLVAHNREDQAETFLLRLGRGSGIYGLSGMAAVEMRRGLRLVRPLLDVPRARLVASLKARGQDWIEDPSNRNEKFLRVRARRILTELAPEGLEVVRIAGAAARLRQAREAIDDEVAGALVSAATIHPEGYARLDTEAFMAVPKEISFRALARVLMTVSGSVYPPRFDHLSRLREDLTGMARRESGGGRTLHGCRITRATGEFRASRFALLVTRELSAIKSIALAPGQEAMWDGRFRVRIARPAGLAGKSCEVGPLDSKGWAAIRREIDAAAARIPAPARFVLPAFRDATNLIAVPHLGFIRAGVGSSKTAVTAAFAPILGLTS